MIQTPCSRVNKEKKGSKIIQKLSTWFWQRGFISQGSKLAPIHFYLKFPLTWKLLNDNPALQ